MPYGKKPFNQTRAANGSRFFYAKFVGRANFAGVKATTVTMDPISDEIEFLVNAVGDPDINDYTGAAGAAGRIRITDANANTVGEVIDIINGIGVGQDGGFASGGSRRYRASLADFPRKYALTTGDMAAGPAISIQLGARHPGFSVFSADASLALADDRWVGLGNEGGTIKGSGLRSPDFFEDIPGKGTTLTVFSAPSGDRTRQKAKQNDESGVAARYSVVIINIRTGILHTTTKTITVWTEDQDPAVDVPFYRESVAAAALGSNVFAGAAGGPTLVGPPGKSLYVQVSGTGGVATAGNVTVTGYYEQTPRSSVNA